MLPELNIAEREKYISAFKAPEGYCYEVKPLKDAEGNIYLFIFDCEQNKGQVEISQILGGRLHHWKPIDESGNPKPIENLKQALKFLSDQGYNSRNTRKGGNDK